MQILRPYSTTNSFLKPPGLSPRSSPTLVKVIRSLVLQSVKLFLKNMRVTLLCTDKYLPMTILICEISPKLTSYIPFHRQPPKTSVENVNYQYWRLWPYPIAIRLISLIRSRFKYFYVIDIINMLVIANISFGSAMIWLYQNPPKQLFTKRRMRCATVSWLLPLNMMHTFTTGQTMNSCNHQMMLKSYQTDLK